ncbi:glycine--tRNA ligase subunit alpha [Shigella flexneri]
MWKWARDLSPDDLPARPGPGPSPAPTCNRPAVRLTAAQRNPNRLQHYYQFQVIIKPSPTTLRTTIWAP